MIRMIKGAPIMENVAQHVKMGILNGFALNFRGAYLVIWLIFLKASTYAAVETERQIKFLRAAPYATMFSWMA